MPTPIQIKAFFLYLVVIHLCPCTQAATINVPKDYPTIQAGISAALNGDTVLIAEGTYTGPDNRNLDLLGKTITVCSKHGPKATVIDAESADRCFWIHQRETRLTRLEGLTMIGGYTVASGGAILCEDANPTFAACTFRLNQAGTGGALAITSCSHVVLEHCSLSQNQAATGGAIHLEGSSTLNLHECRFQNNTAATLGGALNAVDSTVELSTCIFDGNCARSGGAVTLDHGSAAIVLTTFSDNYATARGGGIYGTATFITGYRCEFNDNFGSFGGALHLRASPSCVFTTCIFRANYANLGGGIYATEGASCEFANCLVTCNESVKFGGGALCQDASPSFLNCTFAHNRAIYGGGIECTLNSDLTVYASILWANIPDAINPSDSQPVITYSDIQGGFPGAGNLAIDPLFVEGPGGIYYLSDPAAGQSQLSPCHDAGDVEAAIVCYEHALGLVCMSEVTTRTDRFCDAGLVDLGYHYDAAMLPTRTPTAIASATSIATSTLIPSIPPTPSASPTSEPTIPPATPTTTPKSTESPIPFDLGVVLELPRFVHPSDVFWIQGIVVNAGAPRFMVPLCFVLNYGTAYWFWPSWCEFHTLTGGCLDYTEITIPTGATSVQVVEPFVWPDTGLDSLFPVYIYGLLLTHDLTAALGEIAVVEWGYGP